MKKIIFLDCDGVITTQKSHGCLDREKCNLLQQIVDETGASIVISSSWKLGNLEETLGLFQKGLWKGERDHRFPFIPLWSNTIIGQTELGWTYLRMSSQHKFIPRGLEIKWWLDECMNGEDFEYVILDDDSDLLLQQIPHFIQTNTKEGLNEEQVKRAIDILNGKVQD